MIEESVEPRRKAPRLEQLPLEPLAVAELTAYIGELRAEIARVETAIAAKQGHRTAADAFFRKP